jgi:dihydrofolate reductase
MSSPIFSAIVARSKNKVIGRNNQLPWHLPADLQHFKKLTTGHHIMMGRKCFESIGRALPNRTNLVLTRNPFFKAKGCRRIECFADAIETAYLTNETELFVIGGSEVYGTCLPLLHRVYLTEIDVEIEDGDTFFEDLHPYCWDLVSEEPHKADEKNKYDYTFKVYERKPQTDPYHACW